MFKPFRELLIVKIPPIITKKQVLKYKQAHATPKIKEITCTCLFIFS